MTTTNEMTTETMGVMIGEMHRSAELSAKTLNEAHALICEGNRNGAVGALAEIERQIDNLKKLYDATLALHRS